jgi:hypothetical protein
MGLFGQKEILVQIRNVTSSGAFGQDASGLLLRATTAVSFQARKLALLERR